MSSRSSCWSASPKALHQLLNRQVVKRGVRDALPSRADGLRAMRFTCGLSPALSPSPSRRPRARTLTAGRRSPHPAPLMTACVLPLDLGDEPPRVGDMDLALGLRGVFSCCVGASAAASTALGVATYNARSRAPPWSRAAPARAWRGGALTPWWIPMRMSLARCWTSSSPSASHWRRDTGLPFGARGDTRLSAHRAERMNR